MLPGACGRSALPDYSKDGGEAAIRPALTADWLTAQAAQFRLESRAGRDANCSTAPTGRDLGGAREERGYRILVRLSEWRGEGLPPALITAGDAG